MIRRAGPFGLFVRPNGPLCVAALGLNHISGDGGRLHVGSHRVASYEALEAMAASNFFRRLARPLLEEFGCEAFDEAVTAWRSQFRSGQFPWRRAVIPVDAQAMDFRVLRVGTQWVAVAALGETCLRLDARDFPIDRVRLVRITNPRPYLTGR